MTKYLFEILFDWDGGHSRVIVFGVNDFVVQLTMEHDLMEWVCISKMAVGICIHPHGHLILQELFFVRLNGVSLEGISCLSPWRRSMSRDVGRYSPLEL